jgi:hypothetical protein
MAASFIPSGYTATGTAWKTRTEALVHRIQADHDTDFNADRERWFCTGCLTEGYPRPGELVIEAQEHADGCSAFQI